MNTLNLVDLVADEHPGPVRAAAKLRGGDLALAAHQKLADPATAAGTDLLDQAASHYQDALEAAPHDIYRLNALDGPGRNRRVHAATWPPPASTTKPSSRSPATVSPPGSNAPTGGWRCWTTCPPRSTSPRLPLCPPRRPPTRWLIRSATLRAAAPYPKAPPRPTPDGVITPDTDGDADVSVPE